MRTDQIVEKPFPGRAVTQNDVLTRARTLFQRFPPETFGDFRDQFHKLAAEDADAVQLAVLQAFARQPSLPFKKFLLTWVAARWEYFTCLMDSASLTVSEAKALFPLLHAADPQFFAKLMRRARSPSTSDSHLMALLEMISGLPSFDPLSVWLHGLRTSPDAQIRSKAAKLYAGLTGYQFHIQEHLGSPDARIRANAVEGLWKSNRSFAKSVFEAALADSSHRVVINGLVGLYYLGDPLSFLWLLELAQHPSEQYRAAVAWALGEVKDQRGIDLLARMTEDESEMVRNRAKAELPTPSEPRPSGSDRLIVTGQD